MWGKNTCYTSLWFGLVYRMRSGAISRSPMTNASFTGLPVSIGLAMIPVPPTPHKGAHFLIPGTRVYVRLYGKEELMLYVDGIKVANQLVLRKGS